MGQTKTGGFGKHIKENSGFFSTSAKVKTSLFSAKFSEKGLRGIPLSSFTLIFFSLYILYSLIIFVKTTVSVEIEGKEIKEITIHTMPFTNYYFFYLLPNNSK